MNVKRSQGQSVKHVGLDLHSPVFSHGQLYVALSRWTSANRIKVLLPENCENRKTANIVFKEVFGHLHLTCEYAMIFQIFIKVLIVVLGTGSFELSIVPFFCTVFVLFCIISGLNYCCFRI